MLSLDDVYAWLSLITDPRHPEAAGRGRLPSSPSAGEHTGPFLLPAYRVEP